jgi:hypothetical protein
VCKRCLMQCNHVAELVRHLNSKICSPSDENHDLDTLHTINNVTPCFKRCSPVFTMRFVYERWAWGPFTPIALVALLG